MMKLKRSSRWGLLLGPVLAWSFVETAMVPRLGTAKLPGSAKALTAETATREGQAANLRLVNEGDTGPLYECGRAGCAPAQTDDPARKNRGRMDFYVLPDGCVELRSAVLRPSGPGVDVECGPEDNLTSYRCEALECDRLDPSGGDDGASTWPIPLPADCGGRIHELIVLGASTRTPKVYVECDASSGPLGEM